VDQDVPVDYEIERFMGRKGFNRRLLKANLSQSGRLGPLCSHRENVAIAINPNYQSRRSDELGG
jgi:hypothetical protein